jgi:hypothetical protein
VTPAVRQGPRFYFFISFGHNLHTYVPNQGLLQVMYKYGSVSWNTCFFGVQEPGKFGDKKRRKTLFFPYYFLLLIVTICNYFNSN